MGAVGSAVRTVVRGGRTNGLCSCFHPDSRCFSRSAAEPACHPRDDVTPRSAHRPLRTCRDCHQGATASWSSGVCGPGAISCLLMIPGHVASGHHTRAGLAIGSHLSSTPYISADLRSIHVQARDIWLPAEDRAATSTLALLDQPAVAPGETLVILLTYYVIFCTLIEWAVVFRSLIRKGASDGGQSR